MSIPGKKPEGIPIGPFPDHEQARPAGTPVRPGEYPAPATAREKALEDTIAKIKGLGTMAELKAAGIEYSVTMSTWQTEIGGFDYVRPQLRDLLGILRKLEHAQSAELGIVYQRLGKLLALAKEIREVFPDGGRLTWTKALTALLKSLDEVVAECEEKESEISEKNGCTSGMRAHGTGMTANCMPQKPKIFSRPRFVLPSCNSWSAEVRLFFGEYNA